MRLEEVKKNLNKMVRYKGTDDVYRFTACILRKGKEGYYYSAELQDTISGNSVTICKLDNIGVIE